MEMRIPLSAPEIQEQDILAVSDVLRTSRLSLGPKLEEFEHAMASCAGTQYAVAVNSCTSALHLCLRTLGIGEGDEVIVPSFAFIAVANVVRYERAIPVFADVDPVTLNLDPKRVEACVTPKTRAILAVHTFGCPAEMGAIREIAQRNNLCVIEDACEAIGAQLDGKKAGSWGEAAAFGFYPNKQITTGEGGALTTNSAEIAAKARMLRNQGRSLTGDWFEHVEIGYNYRISEMNCALGAAQLRRLDAILQRRESIAESYQKRLAFCTSLALPSLTLPRRKLSWFVYVVRLAERYTAAHRDTILREMKARGIGCARYFPPIHLQPAYRTTCREKWNLPVTESQAQRTIALPFFNRIQEEQVDEVCSTLIELLQRLPP